MQRRLRKSNHDDQFDDNVWNDDKDDYNKDEDDFNKDGKGEFIASFFLLLRCGGGYAKVIMIAIVMPMTTLKKMKGLGVTKTK